MGEIQTEEIGKSITLERRLGLLAFSGGVTGFTACGAGVNIMNQNYVAAGIIGLLSVVNATFAFYHVRKTLREYSK